MKRKDRTAEKAAADPQAVQRGRLRAAAPFGLVFRVVLVVLFVTCAWLRRASARRTCLCQAHATVPTLLKQIKIGLRRFAEARLNYKQLPHYLDVHLQNRLTFGVHLIFKSVSNSNYSKYLSDMLPQ